MSRYYHRRLSWAPLFLLITTKSQAVTLWIAKTRLFFTSLMLYASFPCFQHFCFLLYSILNSLFFIVFALRFAFTLNYFTLLLYCCILISVQQQLITLHTSLFVSLFVLYPVYIYMYIYISQEFDFSERKSSIFT